MRQTGELPYGPGRSHARSSSRSSVSEVQEHDSNLLQGLAQQFNLSYTAFGKQLSGEGVPAYGKLVLSDAWGTSLAPAPITPTGDAAPFQLLAGTVKATYDAHRGLVGSEGVVVSPGHMSGNTGQLCFVRGRFLLLITDPCVFLEPQTPGTTGS